jgi:hypothetical protein
MEIKMKTNRRYFFHTLGAGAAGLGLSTELPLTACTASENEYGNAGNNITETVSGKRKGQMWPIKSELKSKRIKFDVPQNQISWTYMK